jgi:cell division protein FtsW (lipid II flippase)
MNGKIQYDAGNTNLKFTVRKKRIICGIWAVFLTAPIAAFLDMYLRNRLAEYQIARIQAMFSSGSETDYLTKMLHSLWRQNKLIGKSKSDVTGILPAFNADYILTYLSSVYGIIAAILLCCVLAVLIFAVFNTALRQKNQLGMMMGCGCRIVFLISFLINVLENLGVFPQSITFLPFFSAGGSCIIISYGLMGIVLSTYRYKNIYPRHPGAGFMSINSKVKKVS